MFSQGIKLSVYSVLKKICNKCKFFKQLAFIAKRNVSGQIMEKRYKIKFCWKNNDLLALDAEHFDIYYRRGCLTRKGLKLQYNDLYDCREGMIS